LRLQQLAEVDPIAAFAGDRLSAEIGRLSDLSEAAYDRFDLGAQRYLSMFVPLMEHGPEPWLMGVYAPEDELARKIRDGQRESIFLGVAVSLLVVTAAIMVGMVLLRPIYSLQRQAQEDPLTGLLNRRSFDDLAAKRMKIINRDPHVISALMIDIDSFKPINDEFGHTIGDEVLQAVSRRLTAAISTGDLLARYGGEEFALLLSGANRSMALQVAERLRDLIADQPFKTSGGQLNVTISIGVAERQSCDEKSSELLHRADIALLAAKQAGRNRVILAD
jgi:diguanylate cyclase (GGDEF)-like protein